MMGTARPVHAESLYLITKEGAIQKNVLGDSTELKAALGKVSEKIASAALEGVKEIAFTQIEEKTHIKLETPQTSKEELASANLTHLVDIESDSPSDTISIEKKTSGFGIVQKGVTALTTFPVSVEPATHKVSVRTSVGSQLVAVLPAEALETLFRADVLNRFPTESTLALQETDTGELVYAISGEKAVTIGQITTVVAPVTTFVSATTGKVQSIDQPRWLPVLTFLFG